MASSTASKKVKDPPRLIKREAILYGALFLNTLITVMNTSMFNVALPDISKEFKISAASASLIVSSYSIVFALSAILYSKFSSSLPIKKLISIGIVLLGIGSLIGMMSSSYALLVAARVIQALGASSVSALSIIITTRYIQVQRRGRRLGVIASAVTLGFGLGPVAGGVLTQYLGWEYLFGISLLALISIPVYLLLLPIEIGQKEVFDFVGMALFFSAVVLLLSGITSSWSFALIAIFVIALYILHIHRHPFPFMQPKMLRDTRFIPVIGIGFIIFYVNFSLFFSLPLILNHFWEMENAALIGLTLFPGAVTASISSVFIGKAVDRYGPETVMFFGTFFMSVAILFATLFGSTSILFIILIFSISSSSFVCITTSLPNILTKNLPADQVTTGIGTLQLFQYIGGGIGVTVSGKLLTLFQGLYPNQNEYILVFSILFTVSLGAIVLFYLFAKKNNTKLYIIPRTMIRLWRFYRLKLSRIVVHRRGNGK